MDMYERFAEKIDVYRVMGMTDYQIAQKLNLPIKVVEDIATELDEDDYYNSNEFSHRDYE